MNKETIIVLIEKEINELSALTKGFAELAELPQPLLNLAIEKADNLRDCLAQLVQREKPVVEAVEPEPNVAEPAHTTEPLAEPVEEVIVEPVIDNEPISEPIVEVEPQTEIEEAVIVENEPAEEEIAEPESVVEEISAEPEAQPAPIAEPEKVEAKAPDEPHIVAETIHKAESVVDSFSHQAENSVASNLAHQHIADIKAALSIADRFRFQRELFDGNGEKLTKTLDAVNACTSFEQALNYFDKNFRWDAEDAAVKDFLTLVQRRFA